MPMNPNFLCCIGAELKNSTQQTTRMSQVYLYRAFEDETLSDMLSAGFFNAAMGIIRQDDLLLLYSPNETTAKYTYARVSSVSSSGVVIERVGVDATSISVDTTGYSNLSGNNLQEILNNLDTTITTINNAFVKKDGSSIMTGHLKFRDGSFVGAIAGGLGDGISIYKLKSDNTIDSEVASLTKTNGFTPGTTNAQDIGSSSLKWKDLYVARVIASVLNNGADINIPTQAGTIALLSDIPSVSVKKYGAVGDGITDDTTAIQSALDSGNAVISFPEGTYIISDTLILPETVKKIIANGATIKRTTDKAIFYKTGSVDIDNIVYPTAAIEERQNYIDLSAADAAKYSVGDWVFVRSNTLTPNVTAGSRVAFLRRISSVSTTRVYVESSFFRSAALSEDGYALRMCQALLAGKVVFEGGTYTSINQTGTTALFDFLLCYAPDFINVNIKDSGGAGIRLAHCIGGNFTDSHVSNLLDDRDNGHFGYGVLLAGSCIGFSLNSGTLYKCRHGITTASVYSTTLGYQVARDLPIAFAGLVGSCGEPESCYFGPAFIYGCTNSGLNTHEQGYAITITPNVSGCFDGVHVRNSDVQIVGGQIINCRRFGVRLSTASSNPTPTVDINCLIQSTTILNTSIDGGGDCEGIRNNAAGANITVCDTKISGFINGIVENVACDNLYISGCEIDSNSTISSQRGIWLIGTGRRVVNTIIKNCARGIDTTTNPTGNIFRHVDFVNCTYNTYPETYPLVLNEHEVPRGYFISGRYYSSGNGSAAGNNTFAQGSCRVSPIYIREEVTISSIGINVTTAASENGVVRLGIYNDNGFGYPRSLIIDAGTVDVTTTGEKEITGLNLTLAPGLYWLAGCTQGSPATEPKLSSTTSSNFTVGAKTISASLTNSTVGYGQTVAGAFPATFASDVASVANAPKIAIKIS